MSDETSKSQDPERRRRRRRRRGPRADAPGGDSPGGERPERAPRAQAAGEVAGERPERSDRGERGDRGDRGDRGADARRRRRRRRRPREEGETSETAGGESRESAGGEGREPADRDSREAGDGERGAGRGARARSRRGRRRGGRPTGSLTPGAEARDGQGATDEGARPAERRPRRLQDRVEPSGSDDPDDGDDERLENEDDDDTEQDEDRGDRARSRAGSDDERPENEDDGEDDEDEDEDGEDEEDEDDSDERAAAAVRAPARASSELGGQHGRDEHEGDEDEGDEHDGDEEERARQLAVFLRSADRLEGPEAVPHAIDVSDSEREDENSGVWSVDEGAGGAGDDDHLPALPVPERAHYEEPPNDDPDPVTWILDQSDEEPEERALDRPVHNVVGIKFASAGRIYPYDAGDETYARGEEVVVETERGTRTGVVAVPGVRKVHNRGELKPVLRRPSSHDRRTAERNEERCREALQIAREVVRELALPMKVFRTEYGQSGKKATVYFTSEERVDFRDLVRDLSKRLRCRVEMRQTGVRDEAKQVGGIGSCGRELCCTTWLPEFVPVSIKMAKDQGLVLNPTKVSGQCGRLKCCLVYEQETYAALRKGLPKLGKRVITDEGEEGRVVEVDVLRQRVRVALAPGEFRVLEAGQIKPMFPSQAQKTGRPPGERPPK